MYETIENICVELDTLQKYINSAKDSRKLNESLGWNAPTLNKHDFSSAALNIFQKLKTIDIDLNNMDAEIDADSINSIKSIPIKIKKNSRIHCSTPF